MKKGPLPGLKKVGKEHSMTERDIAEERSSQLHRFESLKTPSAEVPCLGGQGRRPGLINKNTRCCSL